MTTHVTEIVLPGIVEPEGLQVRRREVPAPGPGQARLRMEATGVSFAEQQMRRGNYYDQPPYPFVPGYDVVGTVAAVGEGVDPGLVGRRFAALTKVGAWASELLVPAADLVEVPAGLDPAVAEALIVNGITAWRMLHRLARVRAGQTVLVLGATGGVGSLLVQLARHAGVRVVGTASARNQQAVRDLGAEPVDYADPDLPARVRELVPGGVDAVFDHVAGPGLKDSFRLLARGGTLVGYGNAAHRDDAQLGLVTVLRTVGRLAGWNLLPNGRGAHFFNLWAGVRDRTAYRARLRADLTTVLALAADGSVEPRIAARVPLADAVAAMRLAESRTAVGKVVIVP